MVKIQIKLCKSLGYRYGFSEDHSINDIYDHFNINKMQTRRQIASLIFFFKVVNGLIDAPDINSSFEFAPVGLVKTQSSAKNYRELCFRRHSQPHHLARQLSA